MSDELGLEVETETIADRARNFVKKLNPSTGNGPTVVKLLLYGAMCFSLLMALIILIGNRAYFADRASYSAELEDVTGLFDADSVRISGVPVGRVTSIKVEDGVAVVDFEVDDHIEIPADTQVGVRWRNVLGQKYLYLYPGESTEMLEPGARIDVSQAVLQADFGRFLNTLGPVLQKLDPQDSNAFVQAFAEALEGNEQKAKDLLADAAVVTGTVGDLDTEIGTIITQLEALVTAVNQRDGDLTTIIDDLGLTAKTLADNNDLLVQVIDSFTNVQAQLREMVAGNRVELDTIIDDLVIIGNVLEANLDSLDLGLATLPTGLSPYHEISAQGQWFNVRARILCFAAQTTCVSEDPLSLDPIVGPIAPASSSPAAPAAVPAALDEPTDASSGAMTGDLDDWFASVTGVGP